MANVVKTASPEIFEEGHDLILQYSRPIAGTDNNARLNLRYIHDNDRDALSRGNLYCRKTWGYTILRTVYTPESDILLPKALEKLNKWLYYSLHMARFPWYGKKGEETQVPDGRFNEELWKRLHFDLVEDKDNLSGAEASPTALCEYFRRWVVSKGVDPDDYRDPRFWDCLVLDEESLRSIMELLPDEPPPFRVARDFEEKGKWVRARQGAFLRFLDSRVVRHHEIEKGHPGLVKIAPYCIHDAWFDREDHWNREWGLNCEEQPKGSGDFWYVGY